MPNETTYADRVQDAAGLVTADRVKVWADEFHVIHLSVDGQQHDDVRAVRAFPLSSKAPYVSFLDEKNKELALLANPDDLDEESRAALERALELNYFVPKVVRVDSITETWGVTHWHVETDSGYANFEVIDREKIRKLPGSRFIIVDADENRYEIEDATKMDARSQALIHSET